MAQVQIFDSSFKQLIGDEVKFLQMVASEARETKEAPEKWTPSSVSGLICSYCKTSFNDVQQQREHYKLDWHRYNLKQSLLSRSPLTEEEFNERADDVSSISGSESEKEDNLESIATSQGKIFLKTSQGVVFSMYRCLLFAKKEELDNNVLLDRLRECNVNNQWTVIMLGGGHFAGAVFRGSTPILHKTFHCYTVRAGQGGSQSSKDNRSGSQCKSAGASLRRYNETALVQHVHDILETWQQEIANSGLIIYRATGAYNQSILFSGKVPLLNRSDSRLRTVPFSTRRATFTEVKRVHGLLSCATLYESSQTLDDVLKHEVKETSPKRSKVKNNNINRAKSRENVERPLPVAYPASRSNSLERTDQIPSEDNLYISEQEISTKSLLENFDDSLTLEERRRKKPKKTKSRNKRQAERETLHKAKVYELMQLGNIPNFELYLKNAKIPDDESDNKSSVINEVIDAHGNSLLHIAAMHRQFDLIRYLLEHDADPCLRNSSQQTPYSSTQDGDVRTVFKTFASEFPEKYNYNKAQIPIPAVLTDEQLEKRKLVKKLKREKEKEKKKATVLKKQEECERERFLQLSDREKRALAAERRILSQGGTVVARCFLCASDMSGKVPFEYSGNKFCTIDCLKAHRLAHPIVLS
uniref:VLRF1 domain-containing protein n=2 Tax=Photinus pyralis TaxID=7054 RepID=A0A1Y1NCG2_PHOPY